VENITAASARTTDDDRACGQREFRSLLPASKVGFQGEKTVEIINACHSRHWITFLPNFALRLLHVTLEKIFSAETQMLCV